MSVVCMMGIEKRLAETDLCYLGLPSELIGIDILGIGNPLPYTVKVLLG